VVGDAAGGLGAEIGHHGDTRAIEADELVHAVDLAGVGQRVEREGDVAGLGVGDADALRLGKAVGREAVEDGGADLGAAPEKRARPP
jgi:hypothetical protein